MFVTSIARQLADQRTLDVQQRIRDAVRTWSDREPNTSGSMGRSGPLATVRLKGISNVFLVAVDALDEYNEERSTGALLRILPQVRDTDDKGREWLDLTKRTCWRTHSSTTSGSGIRTLCGH